MFNVTDTIAPPRDLGSPHRVGRPRLYPFGDVQPGQSFRVDGMTQAVSARASLTRWKIRHPAEGWISKREGDGIRFWRVK